MTANIHNPRFDEDTSRYARAGYQCRRARLGYQARCEQLGLSLWELAPGAEGTSHYHHANEELLVVLAGRPSLLVPDGWRELAEGDVVAFPRGPRGAHAPANRTDEPVRLLFFSEMRGPDVVIYPDIGVVGVLEEMSSPERGGLAAWLRLDDALERHEGAQVEATSNRDAEGPGANLFQPAFDANRDRPGFTWRRALLGHQARAEHLGASLFELPPGQASFPFHYHFANEELLVAVRGRPTLRTNDGMRELDEGEVVAFPVGTRGAHQVLNRTGEPVRFLIVSQMLGPEVTVYPDSEKVGAREHPPGRIAHGLRADFLERDAVDYFEGEEPPGS